MLRRSKSQVSGASQTMICAARRDARLREELRAQDARTLCVGDSSQRLSNIFKVGRNARRKSAVCVLSVAHAIGSKRISLERKRDQEKMAS